MDKGEKLKQAGIQESLLNVDMDWRLHAEDVINDIIKNSRSFTSDDVLLRLENMGVRSVNNSALGGVIQRFAKQGKIEHLKYEPSKRPSRHKAPVRVWRSLVFDEKLI